MPAILGTENLGRKVFGAAADAGFRLRQLAEEVNPDLKVVRLEIRAVPKMGFVLADLGGE